MDVHYRRETPAEFESWKQEQQDMKRRKVTLQSKLPGTFFALGSTGMAEPPSSGTAVLQHVASRPDIIDLTEDSDDEINEYVVHPHRSGVHVKRNTQDYREVYDKKRLNVKGRSSENSGMYVGDVKTQVSRLRISTAEGINYPQAMQHSRGLIEGRENSTQSNAAYDLEEKNYQAALSKSDTCFTKLNLDGSGALEANLDEGLLSVSLLRHQKVALAWMMNRELEGLPTGGILADDQGLGKTITTISLILKERAPIQKMPKDAGALSCQAPKTTRPAGGTLVVCPTSVLRQWAHELKEKVTELAGLSVLIHHGSNRKKDPDEVAKYDIVLTTYSIVSMEVPADSLPTEENNEKDIISGLDHDFPPPFRQASKAKKSKKATENGKKGLGNGKGKLVKGEGSVHSGGPLARVHWFRVVLDEAQSIKNARTQVARAASGLRAKRRWCLSGTPLQNAVDDLYSYFRFLRFFPFDSYKTFREKIKEPITRFPSEGYRNLRKVLSIIMIRRTKATKIGGQPIVNLPPRTVTLKQAEFSKEERAFYDNLESESRKLYQDYAAAGTVQCNYMNILWMILRLRQACDHRLLVKGDKDQGEQNFGLDSAKKLSIEQPLGLLSFLEASTSICSICRDLPDEAVVCICGHVFCRQCISEQLATGDDTCCPLPNCKTFLNSASVFTAASLKNSEPCEGNSGVGSFLLEPPQHEECKSSEDVGWKSSSKIDAVMDTLCALPPISVVQASNTETMTGQSVVVTEKMQEGVSSAIVISQEPLKTQVVESTEKAIVFSQWTSMLDLLEVELKKAQFNYRRLDGSMSVLARDRAVSEFKTQPEVTVIIMSLKAASLGLNMVAASHVLLLDVWWNPTTEDQAIDRAHRIGQTRAVKVSRFTVKNTIEDKILALQEKKRLMVASAYAGKDVGVHRGGLSEEELEFLFGV